MSEDFAINRERPLDRHRWRVGLAPLMGLVAIVAVGLATMKVATEETDQIAFAASLLALLIGTLGALVRRRRGPWIGFALFGWAYAVVALVPPVYQAVGLSLPANEAVARLADWIHPPLAEPVDPLPNHTIREGNQYFAVYLNGKSMITLNPAEAKAVDAYMDRIAIFTARDEAAYHARQIGYSFTGLIFAFCGAIAGYALSDRFPPTGESPEARTSTLPG